jgi:hypothetical protein
VRLVVYGSGCSSVRLFSSAVLRQYAALQAAVCGSAHSSAVRAVRALVCGSALGRTVGQCAWQCEAELQCAAVMCSSFWQCLAVVHTVVCARSSVRQCAWQCMAVW